MIRIPPHRVMRLTGLQIEYLQIMDGIIRWVSEKEESTTWEDWDACVAAGAQHAGRPIPHECQEEKTAPKHINVPSTPTPNQSNELGGWFTKWEQDHDQ